MSSSAAAAVPGDHCHYRPGCPGAIMPTPTGELLCSYCHSQLFEQLDLLPRSCVPRPFFPPLSATSTNLVDLDLQPAGLTLFSPGDNCNRPGCAGTLSGESDHLVCSDCHSSIVEQFLSNRSPPPSTYSLPLSSSAATRLNNVFDQKLQPAEAGHGGILNMNLDLDAAVEEIRQLQENNPNLGINIIPPETTTSLVVVQELADVNVVNEDIWESECVMCRARFGNGLMQQQHQVKRCPCGHLYHRGCILTWFNLCVVFDKALVCRVPLCRFQFSPAPVGDLGLGLGSEHE